MYGAFWEGKIIYYSWIFLGGTFHDRTDGFSLTLNPNEAYCFDYKGVSASVPKAFRSFRLLSALMRVMLNQARPKLGERPEFFALVDPDNKISTKYHFNILKGWAVGSMNLYRFLWWKWVTKNHASINLKSIREEINWPPLEIKAMKERERKYREQDIPFGTWTLKTKTKWWNQVELWNVLKASKVKNGDKVLDIGCSDGRFMEYLHNRFPNCHLFGIDFARNPLKELRKKPFLSQAVCGDVTDLPFKPASFDRAVAIQVTQHLPSRKERIRGLKNIHSVLKENGILSLSVDNQNTWAEMVENGKEGPFIHTPDLYIYLYNPTDLKEELEEAGFFEIKIREINNLPVNYLRKLKFLGVWLDLLITYYFKSSSLKRGCYLLAACQKGIRNQ
ncbi:MAG: methyltransferase domain-containing protein [Thermodesulfobacteriota bacterium]